MCITSDIQAYKVRQCIPLQGEDAARGQDLLAPLHVIDNALLLVRGGRLLFVGPYSPKVLPAGLDVSKVQDLGDEILVPAVVNAHTHTQLAHMAEQTTWGQGFVPWLKSLIPLLSLPYDFQAIDMAVQQMHAAGTGYFADYGHGGLHLVAQSADKAAVQGLLLAEWFGFTEKWHDTDMADESMCLPPRAREIFALVPKEKQAHCIPCIHALYSTAPETIQRVHGWCSSQKQAHRKPFVLHLAEFPEEVQALVQGDGALVDLFKPMVLPENWRAPGLHPVDFAQHLGVLTPNTVAVHAVHCEEKHVQIMEQSEMSVCLCPSSNAHLAVGTAPVQRFMRSKINLCLGTDGLTSNTHADVWQEALYLQKEMDLEGKALLRMLTVNGAKALGVHASQSPLSLGSLTAGGSAQWSFVPQGFQC